MKKYFYYKRFTAIIDEFKDNITTAKPNIKYNEIDEQIAKLNKIDANLSSELYCLTPALVNKPLETLTRIIDEKSNIPEIK